tara:strand:+ start:1104 stop:1835 length:732 start_codon:yes stop_codon:yes gene_type:complete
MTEPSVEFKNISKNFGGIKALDNVSIELYPGQVVGLLGHNGAGKSTLIKILSGALTPDSGQIIIDGKEAIINNPRDAKNYGIEAIYQNLALAENLNPPANVFLGREITTAMGIIDNESMEHETSNVLSKLKLHIQSLKGEVRNLSGGQRQAIAISRAIYFDAKILIMDEPTAALGPEETAKVGDLIHNLKKQNITIILISHDIHDVFDYSDRVAVLKNGALVGKRLIKEVSKDDVLKMIISGD